MVREGSLEEGTSGLTPEELQDLRVLGWGEGCGRHSLRSNIYKGPEMKDSKRHWRRTFPLSENWGGGGRVRRWDWGSAGTNLRRRVMG